MQSWADTEELQLTEINKGQVSNTQIFCFFLVVCLFVIFKQKGKNPVGPHAGNMRHKIRSRQMQTTRGLFSLNLIHL